MNSDCFPFFNFNYLLCTNYLAEKSILMAGANRRNGPWDREWDFIACITHSVGLRPYFEYSPCRWQDTLIWIQYSSVTVTQLLAYLCTFVRFREFPRMCQKVDVFLSKCVKMTDGYWAPKLNGCDVRERVEPWKLQFTALWLPNQFFSPENTS